MMKKIFLFIVAAGLATFSFAQDIKNVVYDANAQPRKVESFNSIEISSAVTIYVAQGNDEALAVSADNNETTDKIKTEVKNGVLKIYIDNGFWNKWSWSHTKFKAYITVKNLNKLYATGQSHIIIVDSFKANNLTITASGQSSFRGTVTADKLNVSINGQSSIRGTVTAEKLNVTINGQSSVTLNGTVDDLNINASGQSSIKASDLLANTCNADVSGQSSVTLNITKEFSKIHATGQSSVRYKGNAVIKDFETNGQSSIKKDSK